MQAGVHTMKENAASCQDLLNNGKKAKNVAYYPTCASVVERSITPRCRRGGFGLRGFESLPTHKKPKPGHAPGFVHFGVREGFERVARGTRPAGRVARPGPSGVRSVGDERALGANTDQGMPLALCILASGRDSKGNSGTRSEERGEFPGPRGVFRDGEKRALGRIPPAQVML
jgi:hypothetical protein